MLSFLVAVVYVCMAGSDIITRAITGTLLAVMTLITLVVLYADWKTSPPIYTKSLWQYSRDLLRNGVGTMKEVVDGLLRQYQGSTRRPEDDNSYSHPSQKEV